MSRRLPNLLALETSSRLLSVAVKKGAGKISELTHEGAFEHAENILPLIDRLLKKNHLTLRQIDVFLIGQGPGSFTGLRIGFATLKGCLCVRPKPCYGASSMDLIADRIPAKENLWLCILLDARRGKFYIRFYRYAKSGWKASSRIRTSSFSDLNSSLPAECLLAGDGLRRYPEEFEALAQKRKIYFVPESRWLPRASSLIIRYAGGNIKKALKKLSGPGDFLPLYLRLSEAEEKRNDETANH